MTDGYHTAQTPEPREPGSDSGPEGTFEVPPSGGATWRQVPEGAPSTPESSPPGPDPVAEPTALPAAGDAAAPATPGEPTSPVGGPTWPHAGWAGPGEPTPPAGGPTWPAADPTWPGAGWAGHEGAHPGAPTYPGTPGWAPPATDPTWPGGGWRSPGGSPGAGWPPAAGGWAMAPGGGWVPPGGGWVPPAGWGPQPPPRKPLRRSHLVAIGVAAAVVVLLLGTGLGYLVRSPGATPAASQAPNHSSTTPFTRFRGGTTTSSTTGGGSRSSQASGSPSDVSSIAAKVDPGLVDINTKLKDENEEAAGTGMVLTADGEVLTNNHVIDGATTITATDIGNGKTYTATVVGYDRTNDVAVIQLKGASNLTTVSIGDSSKASVGEGVVGIGNAGGVGGTPSTAGGSITALDQSITATDSGSGTSEHLNGLIETNCGIEPGDSGGPLVDSAGQVIGMDTAASETSGGNGGGEFAFQTTSTTTSGNQGYSIPIGQAVTLAKKIEAGDGSTVVHIGQTAFLGVQVSSTGTTGTGGSSFGTRFGTTRFTTSRGSRSPTTSGADIAGVIAGTPASGAGLGRDDVITTFGGTAITSATTLTATIEGYHPGDHVKVTWTNASGQQQSATVTLANGPAA